MVRSIIRRYIMDNYMLINRNDTNPGQPEFFGPEVECSEYAVTNPAWNTRIAQLINAELDDERALEPFINHMRGALNCEHVQSLRFCETRNTHLFTAMYF
jgi:hypothetical protein